MKTNTLMTFNVLNAWQPRSAVYKTMIKRSADAAEFIKRELPDILCLQEFDYYYRHDGELISGISEKYAEADTQDEIAGKGWNCIFYRKDKYRAVESGGYNFVANGFSVVPIKSDEDAPPRSSNEHKYLYPEDSAEGGAGLERTRFRSLGWAVLEDTDGARILVATTHFSLRSQCQPDEVTFVFERLDQLMKKYQYPTFLCGDFNSSRGNSFSTKLLLEKGLLDTFDMAEMRDDIHSCHKSSGKGTDEPDAMPCVGYMPHAIDHILVDRPIAVSRYKIYAENELLAVSDHCPTMVEFKI